MKEGKPFFYRVDAGEFLAAVVMVPEDQRADWVLRLALDLVSATHSTDFAQKMIQEARNYKEKKANAGRKGMESRYNSDTTKPNTVTTDGNTDITSNRSSNSSSTETELKSEKHVVQVKPSRPPRGNKLSDEEWMQQVKINPAYRGIDIDREFGKMQAWCMTKGKDPSRTRFLNWLNRADKSVQLEIVMPQKKKVAL